jgi:Protein of unknown function (DUF3467)
VGDSGQPEGIHTHLQPQQSLPVQPTNEVVVDDKGSLPDYANFCRVTSTPEEVILDFGLNPQPFTVGRQDVKVNHRVVMTHYTTKRLLAAIGMTIQRHEQTFGPIELDVNRRVFSYQPQLAPSAVHGSTTQPATIRL